MTAKREIPISGDSLGWVHNEISELKSRISVTQQAAEQSRALASEAADRTQQFRAQLAILELQDNSIQQTQDAVITMQEQLARAQDDVQSLRQSRDEAERRAIAESEKTRLDRNEIVRSQAELERKIASLVERSGTGEELSRRHLDAAAQLTQRQDVYEANLADGETWRGRIVTTLSRLDQDVQRFSTAVEQLGREHEAQRERTGSVFENLRRLESESELARETVNRMSQFDDRLELVQAERTRHNERINELSLAMETFEEQVGEQRERASLLEARMAGYQDDIGGLREKTRSDLERLVAHLREMTGIAADLRKREITALEKEIRDIRGLGLDFAEE